MNKLFINFVIVAAIVALCCAANPPVKQCQNQNFDDLENRIKIDPCSKTKCKLPTNTNVTVEFRFMPEAEVRTLKNEVSAIISNIPLPFIGTTGMSACGNILDAETNKPTPCPLKAGKEYIYKNIFFVYPFYPKLPNLLVHWSLNDDDRQVICFEVPAAIVEGKNR